MNDQSLLSTLIDIVKRLDRIEKLLNKSNDGYMVVETEVARKKYLPPSAGYFNDSDSENDIPNDDTYESDTDDTPRPGKFHLLTPNQVELVNKKNDISLKEFVPAIQRVLPSLDLQQ